MQFLLLHFRQVAFPAQTTWLHYTHKLLQEYSGAIPTVRLVSVKYLKCKASNVDIVTHPRLNLFFALSNKLFKFNKFMLWKSDIKYFWNFDPIPISNVTGRQKWSFRLSDEVSKFNKLLCFLLWRFDRKCFGETLTRFANEIQPAGKYPESIYPESNSDQAPIVYKRWRMCI